MGWVVVVWVVCWVGGDGYCADCLYVGAGVACAYYFGRVGGACVGVVVYGWVLSVAAVGPQVGGCDCV